MEATCSRCQRPLTPGSVCPACPPANPPAGAAAGPGPFAGAGMSDFRRNFQNDPRAPRSGMFEAEPRCTTDSFDPSRDGHPPLDPRDVGQWAALLKASFFLILSSIDTKVLQAAPAALVKHAELCRHEPRLVVAPNPQWPDMSFQALVNWDLDSDRRGDSSQQTLVIIDATEMDARDFVSDLLFQTRLHYFRSSVQKLTARRRWCLLLATAELLDEQRLAQPERPRRHIPHAAVPFVGPYVGGLARETSQEAARRLAERIEGQRAEGRWGSSARAVFDRLRAYSTFEALAREVDRIDAEKITIRTRGAGAAASQEDTESAEKARERARALVADNSLVKQAILYTATTFPNLEIDDFQAVLLALLGDRTVRAPRTGATNGAGAVPLEVPLRTLWFEQRTDLLRACRLLPGAKEAQQEHRAPGQLGFVDPRVIDELPHVLVETDPWIHVESLRRIQESGLFFRANADLAKRLVRFAVETVSSQPERYGQEWILWMVLAAGSAHRAGQGSTTSAQERLQQLLVELSGSARSQVFNRVYHLLWAMLERPALVEMVHQFLHTLLSLHQYEALIQLLRRLRSEPAIDEGRWLRRILDEGMPAGHELATKELYAMVRSRQRLGKALTMVLDWLPDRKATARRSSDFSLRLLLDLFQNILFGDARGEAGAYPPAHPLLSFLADSTGTDLLQRVASALFGPGADEILDEQWDFFANALIVFWLIPDDLQARLPDRGNALANELHVFWRGQFDVVSSRYGRGFSDSPAPHLFHALALADVLVLLQGPQDPVRSETTALSDAILRAFHRAAPSVARLRMVQYFHAIAESLAKCVMALAVGARVTTKEEFVAKRRVEARLKYTHRVVKNLHATFKKLGVSSRSEGQ